MVVVGGATNSGTVAITHWTRSVSGEASVAYVGASLADLYRYAGACGEAALTRSP